MPVTVTNLETSANNGNIGATSFPTGSLTPFPNRVMLIGMASTIAAGTPNVPTLSLTGWTFSQINTVVIPSVEVGRITLFTGIGAGAGSILFSFAGQGQKVFSWSVVQVENAKTTGVGGTDAIVQNATTNTNGASYSITLGAFASVSNGVFSVVAKDATNDVVPGAGYTELGEAPVSTPNWDIESMWRPDNNTTPSATFTGSGGDHLGAIAVELNFFPSRPGLTTNSKYW
jgi:hypothetical protein